MTDLAGIRVVVMGLGRFGGGVGVTRWLAEQGADVVVTDLETETSLAESVAAIGDLVDSGRVSLRLGGHNVSDFTTCDLVVANPAVPRPWENRFLRAAEAAGVPVTTEIALLVSRLPSRARTIGVTGSVGKSTTTAMIAHALGETVGDTVLGGNLGGSLLGRLGSISEGTWVVLELSSAMLYWLERDPALAGERAWSPHIAVVTNIAANHLDWHGDLEHYRDSKQHLLRHQREGDHAVLGVSVADWRTAAAATTRIVDAEAFDLPLTVPGAHNRENAAAALLACRAAEPGIDPSRFAAAIAAFPGLPHRLQLVAEAGGVRFYNDSKSTTPGAALMAIAAIAAMPGMSRDRIHLIAGGYDKKIDLSPIADAAPDLAGLYTVGQTGRALADLAASRGARATFAETIGGAVEAARPRLAPGHALVLSPGCASWDQFENYEKRGEFFIRCVQALAAKG